MSKILKQTEAFIQKYPNRSAAFILAAAVFLFLLPSIITNSYFIHVDIFSTLYLDATGQILPWFKLSKEIIFSGHMPLWNDLSGMGLPLLANMQSAVFFPLSWLFYIFPDKLALVFFIFFKFTIAGFFTYLFLRQQKLSFWPSLIASVAVIFSGAFIIWPQWSLSNVVMLLPVFLWVTGKTFESRQLKYALVFAPLMALGIFAGHPQTFLYVFFVVCCFIAFLLFSDYKNKQTWKIFSWLLGAGALGVAVSTPILLPFLEYLKLSANLDYRAGFSVNPFFLTKNLFISNLIPDFFGNPGYKNFTYQLVPNYSEITMGYVGLVSLLLAIYSLWEKAKPKAQWFFIGLALLCFCLIYRINPVYYAINKLPGFDLDYNNRLLYIWAFCISVLGAYGLENILTKGLVKKRLLWTCVGTAAVGFLLLVVNKQPALFTAAQIKWSTINKWQDAFFLLFIVQLAFAALFIYWAFKSPKGKWLLLLFVFLETGVHGLIFNRTTPDSRFYPVTPVIKFLASDYPKDSFRTFVYGHVFLPNFATWYGFNELSDYDVIYLRTNKQLKKSIADYNYSPEYTFEQPNFNALRFFGAKWLLYPKTEGEQLLQTQPQNVSLQMEDGHYVLLALQNVLPRAFLLQAQNPADLQDKLSALVKNPAAYPIGPVTNFQVQTNGTETFSYSAQQGSYLVTTDNYYPDWFALINNQTLAVQNTFGLRSVAVPAGQGKAVIFYRPKSFRYGLEISAAAFVIWLALYLAFKNKSLGPK